MIIVTIIPSRIQEYEPKKMVLPIAHCIHLPVMPHVSTQTEAAKEVL